MNDKLNVLLQRRGRWDLIFYILSRFYLASVNVINVCLYKVHSVSSWLSKVNIIIDLTFFKRPDLIKEKARYLHHYRRIIFLIPQKFRSSARAAVRYTRQTLFSTANMAPFTDSITWENAAIARAAITRGPGKWPPYKHRLLIRSALVGRTIRTFATVAVLVRHAVLRAAVDTVHGSLNRKISEINVRTRIPGDGRRYVRRRTALLKRSTSKDISVPGPGRVGYHGILLQTLEIAPGYSVYFIINGTLHQFAVVEYPRITTITFVYSSTDLEKIYRWQIC